VSGESERAPALAERALLSTLPPPSLLPHDRATDPTHFADPLIGMVIAERYRILESIGRGGMGVVYRAEHARIGKLMALKLLTGELSRDPQQVARFKREALLASKLSHPNTVQVFDFGNSDTLVYLAMEFLRGEDLSKIIRREGSLSVERTAKVVIQICSSLAEAHDKGIVHRDLKPENIIIVKGQHGEDIVKVLDFGLAKLRDSPELSDVTTRGAIVGTPYYMSPEQIRGETVGPAGDVYSLGALMYACLTGTVVFDAPSPMSVLTRHLTEDPQAPSARRPDLGIPESVDQIVLRTLIKDPARRLASVQELQQALVAELKREGQPSIERLLDSGELRKLTDADPEGYAATRDEVEAYERKLRTRGRFAWALLGLSVAAAAFGGLRLWQRVNKAPVFAGREWEPNDAATLANAIPFGVKVSGQLGKRLDRERSDRDFFRLRVPQSSPILQIELKSLPNLATCLALYPAGSESPFGRYCSGAANRDLQIPALRVEPGEYVLALMQDRDEYTHEPAPPVFENISDDYELTVQPATSAPDFEVEPNDVPTIASRVELGGTLRGRLSWMRDVDIVCAKEGAPRVRFIVEDPHARARGAVLQVTPLSGPDHDVPTRLYRAGSGVKASPTEAIGQYRAAVTAVAGGHPACLSLSLVPNPWTPGVAPLVAPAGDEEYSVRAEAVE
jgi:predicted Ser/Thr protein kinase